MYIVNKNCKLYYVIVYAHTYAYCMTYVIIPKTVKIVYCLYFNVLQFTFID
jgi:hypothetical protein